MLQQKEKIKKKRDLVSETLPLHAGMTEVFVVCRSPSGQMTRTVPQSSGVPRGGRGVNPLPPEIPKAIQNRAKLNPIVKTVKNC